MWLQREKRKKSVGFYTTDKLMEIPSRQAGPTQKDSEIYPKALIKTISSADKVMAKTAMSPCNKGLRAGSIDLPKT